jgi:DNA-binding transcriptional LysR family regulator
MIYINLIMINLEWYRSFIAVYRIGTVSGAAKACSLTQPAVSQHLAALESVTGAPLFVRTPRRMIPTERGKELYSQIAQSFDKLEQTSQRLGGSIAAEKSLLRVGTPLEYFYEVALEGMQDPPFRLWFEFDTARNLAQQLAQNELDMIITPQKTPIEGIEYQYLTTETFWLVGSIHQTLPVNLSSMEDPGKFESWLAAQRWISYGVELPIIRRVWQQVFHHRPEFQPNLVIPNLHAIVKAVEFDYGISILPDYLCHKAVKANRLKLLWKPDPPVENELWIGFKKIDRNNISIREYQEILTDQQTKLLEDAI